MDYILSLQAEGLEIKGATKVLSSTQTQAVVEVGNKCFVVTGQNLEVKKLNLEESVVEFAGNVVNVKVSQVQEKKTLLKRIFK